MTNDPRHTEDERHAAPGQREAAGPLRRVLSAIGLRGSTTPIIEAQTDAIQAQRYVLLRIVRMLFLVVFGTVMILSFLGVGFGATGQVGGPTETLTLVIGLGLGILVALIDFFTPKKKISALLTIFLGVLAGMLATLAISYLIDLLVDIYEIRTPQLVLVIKSLSGIALTYLCIATVLQTQDDFRLAIPYVEFVKQYRGTRPLLLDSSALIDGRLVDVAATGFLQAPMVVPRFVIDELQTLADSQDGLKRAKGRRGLDMISKLQRSPRVDMSIDERPIPGKAVDQMLVELAKAMPAVIVTLDSGLGRVAAIHGVAILNIHELSNALRSVLVPGEHVSLRLVRRGEQAQQAVGYLPDGTMIVAEDGGAHVGKDVELVVVSSLQTSAGRMIFARLVHGLSAQVNSEPRVTEREVEAAAEAVAPTGPSAAASNGVIAPNASNGSSSIANPPPVPPSVAPSVPSADAPTEPATPSAPPASQPVRPARSPFPPRPPASPRQGTPRNPRR